MTAMINSNNKKSIPYHMVKSVAKLILPVPARNFMQATHRAIIFRRAMKKFLWNLQHGIPFDRRVLTRLIYGWGNESWSADTEYLLSCLEHTQACRGPILECGSGLTTLLIGAVAQKSGNVVCSLEHHPEWGNRVARLLKQYRIDSVHMSIQPLKNYTDFTWYEPPCAEMADQYALVICDGPPSATRGGRYGLVPVMKSRLAADCIILLDDANRAEEQVIAKRWAKTLNTGYETLGSVKRYIRFELRGKQRRVG